MVNFLKLHCVCCSLVIASTVMVSALTNSEAPAGKLYSSVPPIPYVSVSRAHTRLRLGF